MAGVSGTDGGYRYYARDVSELQDEYKAETKQAKERAESQVEQAAEAHKEQLRAQERDSDATVKKIRENANRQIEKEKKKANEEVKALKANTYDRLGRYNGEEANAVREQLKGAEEQIRDIQAREREARAYAEERFDQRLTDQYEQNSEDSERAIQAAKNETQKAYDQLQKERRTVDGETVSDARRQYDEMRRQAMQEQNEARRQYELATRDARIDFEHRLKVEKDNSEAAGEARSEAQAKRAEAAIEQQHRSHDEETRLLRTQMRDLSEYEKGRMKAGSEKANQLLKDYEGDFRIREKILQDRHELETGKLKGQVDKMESYQNRQKNQALFEQNTHFAQVISKQNQEDANKIKNLEEIFERDRNQLLTINKRSQAISQAAQEERISALNERTAELLHTQAGHFQDNQRTQAQTYEEKLKHLENKLHQAQGYEDPNQISAAAEAAVRRGVIQTYEKTFEEEQDRNSRSLSSMKENFKNEIHDVKAENIIRERKMRNEAQAETDSERTRYAQFIQDSEFTKDLSLKNKDIAHERETLRVTKANARTIDDLRNQYEEMFENLRFENQQKTLATRNDFETKLKQAHREYATNYNEMSRGYEKRLTDQREEFEILMANEKTDKMKALRDLEKQFRAHSDSQVRGYESRLKESESLHKERERTIAQNYEDEIDKLRRANALLIQKKS